MKCEKYGLIEIVVVIMEISLILVSNVNQIMKIL